MAVVESQLTQTRSQRTKPENNKSVDGPSTGSTTSHRILVGLVILITVAGAFSARYWSASETGSSFSVYYTAATLVRSNESADIYIAVKQGNNPQLEVTDPSTVFALTARAHGISHVMLYLYPPTFADIIVPLTFLPRGAAFIVWNIFNVAMLLQQASF